MTDFFSMPMSAGPRDVPVGVDELGNPVYMTTLGSRYVERQKPGFDGSYVRAALNQVRKAPLDTLGNVLSGAAQGAWDAVSAPGRAAQGEPVTYGDVAETAGMVSLPALAGKYDPAVANMGIRAYHRSNADFDAFEPSKTRGASFFAAAPEAAAKGAQAGQNELARHFAKSDAQKRLFDYEVDIDETGIQGLNYTPAERAWIDNLPNEISGDDALAAIMESKPHRIQWWDDFFQEERLPDGSFRYVKKPVAGKSFQDVLDSGRDIYGREIAHYGSTSDELATARRIIDDGMAGYLVNDEAGISLAVADPSIINILSKNDVTPRPRIRAYLDRLPEG